MQEMIALSPIDYPPAKSHKTGDRFEVEDAHVKILAITGKAKLPDESQTDESQQVEGTLHVKRKYTRREAA